MRHILTPGPGRSAAIRLDDDTLLSVPPMHPDTPGSIRVRIFEYVLRRQVGLAWDLAVMADEEIRHRNRKREQFLGVELAHRDDDGDAAGLLVAA